MTGSGRYDLSEIGPYDYYDGSRFYREAGFVVVRRSEGSKTLRSHYAVVRALGAWFDGGGNRHDPPRPPRGPNPTRSLRAPACARRAECVRVPPGERRLSQADRSRCAEECW